MIKKFLVTSVATISVLLLTVLTFSQALVAGVAQAWHATPQPGLCQQANNDMAKNIDNAKVKGLSAHLSDKQIQDIVNQLLKNRDHVCSQAQVAPFTSPAQVSACDFATRFVADASQAAKEKGRRYKISDAVVQRELDKLAAYKAKACAGVPPIVQPQPLTSAVQLCMEAKKSYTRQVLNLKAQALSLQLSAEYIAQVMANINDYRAQVCQEAGIAY